MLPLQAQPAGVSRVDVQGYTDCIELQNKQVRVVLGHHFGGRVLIYESQGQNVLYLDESESAWNNDAKNKSKRVSAGRFDVGPEQWMVRSDAIWSGPWEATVTADRSAKMVSVIDPDSQMQVTREFQLDEASSRLRIKQTVTNKGSEPLRQCFWSRTFAIHGGIAIVPCNSQRSLLPSLYTLSQNRYLVDYRPNDPAIERHEDTLLVLKPTEYPKMLFDSVQGWVGYLAPTDQLFVKTFPVFEHGSYGEVANANLSIWYPQADKIPAVELEPIGPLKELPPGESASFTTQWWLLDWEFPQSGTPNLDAIHETVQTQCLGL